MTVALAALTLVWAGFIAYVSLGGADFGAGVWDLLASGPTARRQHQFISRVLGPVWEANHVWLIFLLVGLMNLFPAAFALFMSSLFVPLVIALIGIVLRGAGFIFRTHALGSEGMDTRLWSRVFSISSLLTPFFLGAAAAAVAGGQIHTSGITSADLLTGWISPFSVAVGVMAVAQCATLAAVYLTAEAQAQKEEDFAASYRTNQPEALILLTQVPDPENYGVAELNDGRVTRLLEKPARPQTDLALVGVYMFTAAVHLAAEAITPSARGELEITEAIQHLVDHGLRVEPHIVRGWWKDTGRLEDLLAANRLVLDTIDARVEGELVDSQVDGRVVIEPGARLIRCAVRGPAVIGTGATLSDCYIGPYTSVGERCTIEGAEVEHSILLAGSSVSGLAGRMESSLLGRNVRIGKDHRQPRAYRFLVGDNSEIGIL